MGLGPDQCFFTTFIYYQHCVKLTVLYRMASYSTVCLKFKTMFSVKSFAHIS